MRRRLALVVQVAQFATSCVPTLRPPRLGSGFAGELRYAVRRLSSTPGFTAVAVVTLAVGIGANTALFGVVNTYLLHELPIPNVDRMAAIGEVYGRLVGVPQGLTDDQLHDVMVAKPDAIARVTRLDLLRAAVTANSRAEVVTAEAVDSQYFGVVGVSPIAGRVFDPLERETQNRGSVVISERLWRTLFDGRSDVAGQTLRMTGHPLTVIGVLPDSYRGSFIPSLVRCDAWVALEDDGLLDGGVVHSAAADVARDRHHRIFALLRPGATWRQADAEVRTIGTRVTDQYGVFTYVALPASAMVVPADGRRYGEMFAAAIVALAGLVLLIACSNLANLFLARASHRSVEVAIRMATGASRGRIVRLLLAEAAVLTLAAAAMGAALAVLLSQGLAAIDLPQLDGIAVRYEPALDWRVFGFTILLAALATIVVGLVPALRASRVDPARVFASNGGTGGASVRGRRMRAAFVVSQMAGSTILLIAAGLFVRSTVRGLAFDSGLDVRDTTIAAMNVAFDGYDESRGRDVYRRLLDTAARTPGLRQAAIATDVPAGRTSGSTNWLHAEGAMPTGNAYGYVNGWSNLIAASPGLFATTGIRLVRGRDFVDADRQGTMPVAIVNESVASALWPGQDPIGRRLSIERDGPYLLVVGVAKDTDHSSPYREGWRFVFLPLTQHYSSRVQLVVRTVAGVSGADLVRSLARAADPDLAVFDVQPVAQHVALWLVPLRIGAAILSALALTGVVIALLGIYGVTAYVASLRTREFGILCALGARQRDIYKQVLAPGGRTLLLGGAIGVAVSLAAAGLARHLLYGIGPYDPMTFVLAPALLVLLGLAASIPPARRAARADPNAALRSM